VTKQNISVGCKLFTHKEFKCIKLNLAVEMGLKIKYFKTYKKLITLLIDEMKGVK
jgi:hypothetical protein